MKLNLILKSGYRKSKLTILRIIFFILLLNTCKVAEVNPKILWNSNKFDNISSIYPVLYKNTCIASNFNLINETTQLLAFDISNGNIKWQVELPLNLYYNFKPYVFNNILVIPSNNSLISINLEDGKVFWKTTLFNSAENYLEGNNKEIYRTYFDSINNKNIVLKIALESGKYEKIIEVGSESNINFYYRTPLYYENSKSEFLIFSSISQNRIDKKTHSYINIFDCKKKEIVLKDLIYSVNNSGYGVTKQPMVYKENLFLVAYDELVCLDLITFSYKWKVKMNRDILSSQLAIKDDYVLFACEDGFLRKISIKDGHKIWETKITGTASRLFICHEVVHVIGGSNGIWYIINIENGNIIKEINSNSTSDKKFNRAFLIDCNIKVAVLNDGDYFYGYRLN